MYEAALEINSNDYQIWANLAAAYYWAPGEREKSTEYYKQAIKRAEEERKVNPKRLLTIESRELSAPLHRYSPKSLAKPKTAAIVPKNQCYGESIYAYCRLRQTGS